MSIFGFPNDQRFRFRINNRWYRVNLDGAEVLRLLMEIYAASTTATDHNWALRMRPQIRRIQFLNVRSVLVMVIEKTVDPRMRLIAIWLRGRCGGYLGSSTIAKRMHSSDFKTQKECIRALQRLSGWAELRKIANTQPHPRIRKLATQSPAKPFEDRLAVMMANVRPTPTHTEESHLWILPGLLIQLTPAKSTEIVRRVLRRIQWSITRSRT